MPNPLVAKPMLAVGPIDIYRKFVATMTEPHDDAPSFSSYTQGTDFFTFTYDWRQEMATVTAPLLDQALENYARIHERATGIPARETKFILVAHSMGGLVARTLLSEKPEWASRISRLYLVGTPNAGSVKAIRTVVIGPDSLKEYARGFPGVLLNLLPTNVDQNVTKLVGITRPSLYELLPMGDPDWRATQANGAVRSMSAEDVLKAASWEPYWPSAQLEKKLFLDGWLRDREQEGRKKIDPVDWEFCQDPGYGKLKALLSQVAAWRHVMGPLSRTESLLTRSGQSSRLRLVLSTGVKTPTGVISEGEHDAAQAYYIYDAKNDGDGTVERARVIDDLDPASPLIKRLHGVPHGRLMIDAGFLTYLTGELAHQPMVAVRTGAASTAGRKP
jgi:pimeloyl-ACP methyl ester carboxylesterase